MCCGLMAQEAPGEALGDTPRRHVKAERNVLGSPVYYDTLGNVIGSGQASAEYHRPRHHFRNRLEDEFSSVFFECNAMITEFDMAVGGTLTVLPRRWGAYATGRVGFAHGYLAAGPALRLSDCGDNVDWHLFGGLAYSHTLGGELGLRLAFPDGGGTFCWSSVMMSVGYVNQNLYVSAGLSLGLSPSIFMWFL